MSQSSVEIRSGILVGNPVTEICKPINEYSDNMQINAARDDDDGSGISKDHVQVIWT